MEKYLSRFQQLILISLVIFVTVGCEKEKDNRDEVRAELERIEPFDISPKTSALIDLYPEFELRINKNGHTVTWSEYGKKYNSSLGITFTVVIDDAYFIDKQGNVMIANISDSASIIYKVSPKETFQTSSNITLMVEYHFECSEENMFNGFSVSKKYVYKTNANTSLTNSMVYCEYPLPRQYNFMQHDYEFGFIKTNAKPNNLIGKPLRARITNIVNSDTYIKEITYDSDLSILKYSMPNLENNSIYKIEFLIESNGSYVEFYSSNYFKTSSFNTFKEKIGTILEGNHNAISWNLYPCVSSLTASDYSVGNGELLDYYEQVLTTDIDARTDFDKYDYPKLVTVKLDTTRYDINQFGYNLAKELGYSTQRPTDYIGYAPINDFFYFFNWNSEGSFSNIILQDEEIDKKGINSYNISNYSSKCYIAHFIVNDISGFLGQAVNDYDRWDDPRVEAISDLKICNSNIYSKFYYHLYYKIPGINKIVFKGTYEFELN